MSFLISLIWVLPSCEEREASKKCKKENICLVRDSNHRPLDCHACAQDNWDHADSWRALVYTAYAFLAYELDQHIGSERETLWGITGHSDQ